MGRRCFKACSTWFESDIWRFSFTSSTVEPDVIYFASSHAAQKTPPTVIDTGTWYVSSILGTKPPACTHDSAEVGDALALAIVQSESRKNGTPSFHISSEEAPSYHGA